MQLSRRLLPDAAVTRAADRIAHHRPAPVPDELVADLTAAVTALLREGWTVEEVAVVHHLSASDLAALDGVVRRPAVLTVGLHWAREHALWWPDSEGGDVHPADLAAWGISEQLADDLAQWNGDLGRWVLDSGESETTGTAEEEAAVLHRRGYELALRLQDELWDVEVRYALHGSPARPVREQHP